MASSPWGDPISQPGSYVVFRAEMDLVIALSACPQDILPINGRSGRTTERISRSSRRSARGQARPKSTAVVFPPLTTTPTRSPVAARRLPRAARRASTAPAGSATIRNCSQRRRSRPAIASSGTRTARGHESRPGDGEHELSDASAGASASAAISPAGASTGRPACNARSESAPVPARRRSTLAVSPRYHAAIPPIRPSSADRRRARCRARAPAPRVRRRACPGRAGFRAGRMRAPRGRPCARPQRSASGEGSA